jgi:ferrous iron transport protein B
MAVAQQPPTSALKAVARVVLTGNPNSGKTTLFNALTGLRAKVGNYAGVTVERKEGRMLGRSKAAPVTILDLPGTYSLSPQSLDEQISRDVLLRRLPEVPPPELVVVVVDASNLERNLYYATQVIELGYPTLVALNMIDVAEQNGHEIDSSCLSAALGVPVFPMSASSGDGVAQLRQAIDESRPASDRQASAPLFANLPDFLADEVDKVATALSAGDSDARSARAEALLLLSDQRMLASSAGHYPAPVHEAVAAARARLHGFGEEWRGEIIESRYSRIAAICQESVRETFTYRETLSDKLDRVLTHKLWGMIIFVSVMAVMFQSIFTFAQVPMGMIEDGVNWLGGAVGGMIAPGDLNSLLVNGVIAGVGAVVMFLPQILLLFLFIGLLEDTGYMARAAFLMDRLMSKVGLHGKSFIPMLSSFACAIPGIMATRTIETPKDRLATILVAPLMSCSARLPVYTLLIAACIPDLKLFGFLGLQGLTMLAMYLLGVVAALFMAWLFKRTLLRGEPPLLIMELPPYKKPLPRIVLRHMWERSQVFLRRAGTVILGISILLWFLASYPRSQDVDHEFGERRQSIMAAQPSNPAPGAALEESQAAQLIELEKEERGEKLRRSFAGKIGQLIEPAIAPLGFDWKIGIGIVASFAAREVFVSTMSTVYNVGEPDETEGGSRNLAQTLREQTRADGSALYTPLTGLTLMVFYVFALQCVSTIAVVRRETNSWRWPLFQWLYMGALAWGLSYLVFQGGRLLGWH